MQSTAEIEAALPDYEIKQELGRGAMGIVYLGRHRHLDRPVAIKSLPAAFAADQAVRDRFVSEAKVLASLDHPHVVIVHDFVDRDGQCLLVMEELPGGTLWDRFVGQGMTPPIGTALAVAASAGLAHAHERGVLHRDVKPENLMFSGDGQIKVTDFGIAKVVNGAAQMATVDGSVIGTPAYMSPEQANGEGVGPGTDVYATATMLYELLSGRLPFASADSPMAMLVKRLTDDPPPITDIAPHVPAGLGDAVMHGLARDAGDRPDDIESWAIEIAGAAAQAWGPDWLDSTGVVVSGSDRVDAAIRSTAGGSGTTTLPPGPTTLGSSAGRAADTALPGQAPVAPDDPRRSDPTITPGSATPGDTSRSAETVVPGSTPPSAPGIDSPGDTSSPEDAGPAPQGTPATPAVPPAAEPEPMPPMADPPTMPISIEVRPVVQAHDRGADLNQVDPRSLVKVGDIVAPPRHGPLVALAGLVLLAVAILIGITGTDGPDPTGDFAAGAVSLAGSDPTGADPIELDFAEPVAITGDAATASLSMSMLGIPLGSADAELTDGQGVFESTLLQWAFGGAGRGELTLTDASGVTQVQEFAAVSARAWYLTGPGIVAIIVALFSVSYVGSALRPVRRGRPFRIGVVPPLAVAGALVGVSTVGLAASALEVEPTIPALSLSAGLGAVSVVVVGEGVRRMRRASRVRQRRRAMAG